MTPLGATRPAKRGGPFELPAAQKHCRNHTGCNAADRPTEFTTSFPTMEQFPSPGTGIFLHRSVTAEGNDGPRHQHAFPRHDLCRGNAGPVAAVRVDSEREHPCGRLVGLRAPTARGVGHAVRHVRHGIRRDLDRPCQRHPVHLLRRHLDGCARVRWPRCAAGLSGRRRDRLAIGLPRAAVPGIDGRARAAVVRPDHRLHLGHGLRILARPQRAAGVALAGDLHAVRARRAVPAAHAAVADPAVVADQPGVRQRVALRVELRGAAVHHRDCLHPAGHDAPNCATRPPRWSIR